jgi:hypothetical protein
MIEFNVYQMRQGYAEVSPLSIKRQWMDETLDGHAYKCFPVSLANNLGWGVSFPEDIIFIWDGISDTTPDHVKILAGEKYVHPNRGNATISFITGLLFETSKDYSLLTMPVPNMHMDGVSPFTTLISTSFYHSELPCAWRVTRANEVMTIKAGTPIISIFPISLTHLQNSELHLKNQEIPESFKMDTHAYGEKITEITQTGKFSNFYKDAVNHLGETIGEHEIKILRLKNVKEE